VCVCELVEVISICWRQQIILTMSCLMTSGETASETSCLSVYLAQQTAQRNIVRMVSVLTNRI
jgi:hypothetical protein